MYRLVVIYHHGDASVAMADILPMISHLSKPRAQVRDGPT